jgi:outer membrane protein assembly factor BamB
MRYSSVISIVLVIALLTLSIVLIPFTNADWTMYRADPTHSGAGTGSPPLTITTIWKYITGGPVYSSPAVSNGVVYIGSGYGLQGIVYALSASSGAQLWNYTTASGVESSPAVVGGFSLLWL